MLSSLAMGQCYDASLSNLTLSPSDPAVLGDPLTMTFTFCNDLEALPDDDLYIQFTPNLLTPDGGATPTAPTGTAAAYFDWVYVFGTWIGVQNQTIPAAFCGDVVSTYTVDAASDISNPQIGTNVNINPSGIMAGTGVSGTCPSGPGACFCPDDDNVSFFTYTVNTITGLVYEDTNGNGTQDVGELGIPNVDVLITDSDGIMQTVTTDANGVYTTTTVAPGNATIDIVDGTLPAGATQTEGTDPTVVTVPAGGTASDIDGFQLQGTVTGVIYEDTNGNGTQDAGELGIADVTVEITDGQGDLYTVVTDANGVYTAVVSEGDATIDIVDGTLPTGATQTEGTDPTVVTVPAGGTASDIDGFQVQGTVTGVIYEDTNGNGTQDAGELGIADVTVEITDGQGNIYTVTTDSNGDYSTDVTPGDVTVEIVDGLPAGGTQTEGTNPTTVTVPAGGTGSDIDGFNYPTDITPIIRFIPGVVTGTSPMAFQITIQELLNQPTNGMITVVLPKDPRLTFAYDPNMTMAGPYAVSNANWAYNGTNPSFHIWTSSDVIGGLGKSSFGFFAQYDPQFSSGEVTYTVTIIQGSGSENNFQNNIDAETLIYFNN